MIISLTGFMGCGKSSVAGELGKILGRRVVDLDREVVRCAGMPVEEIFRTGGESAFRSIELRCLQDCLASEGDIILALGGGTIMNDGARAEILSGTTCVYLKASLQQIERNLSRSSATRPLYGQREALYEQRLPVYDQAPYRVVTDGKSPREIAFEIARMLRLK